MIDLLSRSAATRSRFEGAVMADRYADFPSLRLELGEHGVMHLVLMAA